MRSSKAILPAILAAMMTLFSCGENASLPEAPRPGDIAIFNLGRGVKLEMIYLRGGIFRMGSPSSEPGRSEDEGPLHAVELDGFWMGKYEITQAQYQAIMGENPSYFKGPSHPVDSVSWNDTMEFCRRLSRKTRQSFRLPTEAEWEFACRAGTDTSFHFGDTISTDLANYNGNYVYPGGALGIFRRTTMPVGSFPPNAFGLHDMHGNVWEWCLDWYEDNYPVNPSDTRKNPKGPPAGNAWVLRGGAWTPAPDLCRSASRTSASPLTGPFNSVGFRVVLSGPSS